MNNYTTDPIVAIDSYYPFRINTYTYTPLPQEELAAPIVISVFFLTILECLQPHSDLRVGFNKHLYLA